MVAAGVCARYGLVGAWIAFFVLIFLYWHSANSIGSLSAEIDLLKSKISEGEGDVDSLRFDLEGSAGCKKLLDEAKNVKKQKEEGVPTKEKEITDKKAAIAKAEEELKKIKDEHPKAKTAYDEIVGKFNAANATCVQKITEAANQCKAGLANGATPPGSGSGVTGEQKSILARILGN